MSSNLNSGTRVNIHSLDSSISSKLDYFKYYAPGMSESGPLSILNEDDATILEPSLQALRQVAGIAHNTYEELKGFRFGWGTALILGFKLVDFMLPNVSEGDLHLDEKDTSVIVEVCGMLPTLYENWCMLDREAKKNSGIVTHMYIRETMKRINCSSNPEIQRAGNKLSEDVVSFLQRYSFGIS